MLTSFTFFVLAITAAAQHIMNNTTPYTHVLARPVEQISIALLQTASQRCCPPADQVCQLSLLHAGHASVPTLDHLACKAHERQQQQQQQQRQRSTMAMTLSLCWG
jgi:hypothetical protein